MKILKQDPPHQIRYQCEKAFDLTGTEPAFMYGDTLYNPFGKQLDDTLLAHESVHSMQQGDDPLKWWHQYLKDKDFRFKQELEAYRVQYRVAKDLIPDRNDVARLLFKMSSDLSSPMYGDIVGRIEALKLIKKGI